ncbi:MAG: hypothetical protein CK424_05530 [Legionella sp.]|nr:MAG: hypothetical protein CK424_05530 [Legionella sp.]
MLILADQTLGIRPQVPSSTFSYAAFYARWKPIVIEVSAWVLAISASMILGMLSFCGMLALWPLKTTRACFSFILAIAYEGEIYLQNIRGSLEKLTTPGVGEYERQMTGLYLQKKLAQFDHNRNRLLITEPTDEDKTRVQQFNEILIIRKEDTYEIGFRNRNGVYEQQTIDRDDIDDLNAYATEQFIEHRDHNRQIDAIYQQVYGAEIERTRDTYPVLVSAYRSQLEYAEQWSNYLHTQPANEAHQTTLNLLNEHASILEQTITEHLFRQTNLNDNMASTISFNSAAGIQSRFDFKTMSLTHKAMKGISLHGQPLGLDKLPQRTINNLSKRNYAYHNNELKKWISAADQQQWSTHLWWHKLYSRLAIVASSFSGIVMGLGTTYLIIESFASIPLLAAISLGSFPGIIVPLALIAGGAYGLLIYNSMTEMLVNNPFTKFIDRIKAATQNNSLKSTLMMGVTAFFFMLTMLLTYCTIGTWLTIFHQHKPLFALMSLLPKIVLNVIIPSLIGLSILPFSIQSIANTLDNIEADPGFNAVITLLATGRLFQSIWDAIPKNALQREAFLYTYLLPKFLGISESEFRQETTLQKWNPYRILYRLLFEPSKTLFFVGHLSSAAVTGDQVEGLSKPTSLLINGGFELAEDYDYLYPNHAHRLDTDTLIKNRFQGSEDHDHDNTIPLRLLNFLFDPLVRRAAQWDYDHDVRAADQKMSVQQRYEKLQGFNPLAVAPEIPKERIQSNHQLFLFKSAMTASAPLKDLCCAPTL